MRGIVSDVVVRWRILFQFLGLKEMEFNVFPGCAGRRFWRKREEE